MMALDLADLSSWKVVVIDDEPENRGVAEYILNFFKANVHCEESGQNCLEVLRVEHPNFLLLDISMPRKSGWDVLKEIRADGEFKSLPVIALTAHAMTGDEERAILAGFDGYITKPVSPKTLIKQIKEILERVKSRGEVTNG